MSLYGMFQVDSDIEKEGITIDYGVARAVIARAGGSNHNFKRVFQAKSKPYRYQIDNDQLSEEASDKLMAEVYAEAVIRRFDAKDPNGEWILNKVPLMVDGKETIVDATKENIVKLLLDLPELFKDMQFMAGKASHFQAAEDDADQEEVEGFLGGNSNGEEGETS